MLVGGVLASTGYALAPVSTREKVIYIASIWPPHCSKVRWNPPTTS